MPVSLIEALRDGGWYWKRERFDSPGHSVVISNGTPFKIALEGAQSHLFSEGEVRDGHFILSKGAHAGTRFKSPNEVVNTVREPSTNAFLYLHLRVDGHWIIADEFRRSEATRLDEAEELALEDAIRLVRAHPKGKNLDQNKAILIAAGLVSKRPEMVSAARRHLDAMAKIDLGDFDLGQDSR